MTVFFTLKTHYGVKMTGNLPLFAITDGDQRALLVVLYLIPITDLNLYIYIYIYIYICVCTDVYLYM